MPLSYRNIISGNKIKDTLGSIGSDEFQKNANQILKKQTIQPKYVKGYESESFWESVFGGQLGSKDNPEIQSRFGQLFDLENKELDPYDPYTTAGAKEEEFWKTPDGSKAVGRILYPILDEDTNTFRNVLFNQYQQNKFSDFSEEQYEDPLYLGFELFFDTDSPFFCGTNDPDLNSEANPSVNSIKHFFQKYQQIDDIYWRYSLWTEFKSRLFSIFQMNTSGSRRNKFDKPYYINKITGLNLLNKKITKYGEDKISIVLNEDVRMIAWYISELYNNLSYSYRNKRWMIPENLLRFDMHIKISDMRNFAMPFSEDGQVKYKLSPKSTIMFTLHDCSFNFVDSYNFTDEIVMAGLDAGKQPASDLKFDIIYKSVTRWSDFPILNTIDYEVTLNPWETDLHTLSYEQELFKSLQQIKTDNSINIEKKGYWNERLGSITQTVANAGMNYLDNLETRLREERGNFVENSLQSFREWTTINKIEPDNVYYPEFNNRLNLKNAGRQLASDLLNDLESQGRNIGNF